MTITHTYKNDLRVKLVSPDGLEVSIISDDGGQWSHGPELQGDGVPGRAPDHGADRNPDDAQEGGPRQAWTGDGWGFEGGGHPPQVEDAVARGKPGFLSGGTSPACVIHKSRQPRNLRPARRSAGTA